MSTETVKSPASIEAARAKPVIVGVDGSKNCASAVEWAAAEAERSGAALKLLMVIEKAEEVAPSLRPYVVPVNYVDHAYGVVDASAWRVQRNYPDLEIVTDVLVEQSVSGLKAASRRAQMVVVGKRGLGAIRRMMLGSTSIELAGRSTAPTVIVPEGWKVVQHDREPIMVGLDIHADVEELLTFGFERAMELGVPLVAMHVWDIRPAVHVTDQDRAIWGGEALRAVEAMLEPWADKYPDVQVGAAERSGRRAEELLAASQRSQLLVLGRHTSGRSPVGLGVGSVTRAILHHAKLPVAVVPTR
jgi:nucleotide-binding universal stress UspA family protein